MSFFRSGWVRATECENLTRQKGKNAQRSTSPAGNGRSEIRLLIRVFLDLPLSPTYPAIFSLSSFLSQVRI